MSVVGDRAENRGELEATQRGRSSAKF